MKDSLYKLGITQIIYEGVTINIYDKERLLIDLSRNKIGYDLNKLIEQYVQIGYKRDDAISKGDQDIIVLKISKNSFSEFITIKGGVVMHSISKDNRIATKDLDMNFIKYSLENDSINNFIKKINE